MEAVLLAALDLTIIEQFPLRSAASSFLAAAPALCRHRAIGCPGRQGEKRWYRHDPALSPTGRTAGGAKLESEPAIVGSFSPHSLQR